MRHRKAGQQLGRNSSHRKAMFRNMVTSLFKYDRIHTTNAKAKELRGWADHIVTLAKRGDLHARRQALSIVREQDVVHKVFEEAQSRYGGINGGYTRIVKLGRRPGDAAPVCLVELVSEATATPKKTKKKSAPQPKAVAESPVAETAEAEAPAPVTAEAAEAAPAEEAPAEAESVAGDAAESADGEETPAESASGPEEAADPAEEKPEGEK